MKFVQLHLLSLLITTCTFTTKNPVAFGTANVATGTTFPSFRIIEPPVEKSLAIEVAASGYPFVQDMRANFKYIVQVQVWNSPVHATFVNGKRLVKLCLRLQATLEDTFCRHYEIAEEFSPAATTMLLFDVDIELGLGTSIFQLFGDGGNSSALIVDVIPSKTSFNPPPSLAPTKTTNITPVNTRKTMISVAVFGSFSIGGQQILDFEKCRQLVYRKDISTVHFISETMEGSLQQEFIALAQAHNTFIIHLLPRLLDTSSNTSTRFMAQHFEWMASIHNEAQILSHGTQEEQHLWSVLAPLRRVLHKVDVLNLANSKLEAKLFNMLHVARLSGVQVRVVDLPNVQIFPQIMGAATSLVGPSEFACNHPDATLHSPSLGLVPCSVIYPVAIKKNIDFRTRTRIDVKENQQKLIVNPKKKTVTFVFVGRTSAERQPGLFFHAVHLLHTRMEILGKLKVKFVILGFCDPGHQKVYTDFLSHATVSTGSTIEPPDVKFLGVVDYTEVLNVLVQMHVDVLVNTRSLETFGISIVEAMSIGIPAVVCRGGGHNEIVTNQLTGFLVECNAESIANAMEHLAMNHTDRFRLGRAALDPVLLDRFSATKLGARYGDLLNRLVHEVHLTD